jgi:ATP-dependent helicase/nuclease subunit A
MSRTVLQPTNEQRAAARPGASAWVSANAGSGKTRVLTDRVARLLLTGADPSRVLCLTYTKAAAAEMAKRLFETLGAWSTQGDGELQASLAAVEGEAAARERLPEARRLFARALEAPGGLKIETIHAFCQRVLQRFPVEAGVAPDFTVLDDNEAGALAEESKRALLLRLSTGSAGEIEEAFACLSEARGEQGFSALIADGLKRRREIEAFFARHEQPARAAALRTMLGLGADDTAELVRERRHSDPARDDAGLARAASALAFGSDKDARRGQAIAFYLDAAEKAQAFDAYRAVFLRKDGGPLVTLATGQAKKRDVTIEDTLRHEQERLLGSVDRERAAEIAELTLAAYALLGEVLAGYRALKQAHRALDYNDLISATQKLLTRTDAAFVHFKLDGGIDHLLVDEAQDTSSEQWEIVSQLTKEFFAHESAHETRLRTVFAVGDEKQSIYSFQGADPLEFAKMREHFEGEARGAGRDWTQGALEASFRSTPQILEVVDRVFASPEARRALSSQGEDISHRAVRAAESGLVELWPALLRQKEDPSVHRDWLRPVDAPSLAEEAKLGRRIAQLIRRWLNEATPIYHGGPAIGCGDILVLVRRRGALFYEVIRELNRENLPVAGADRMILNEEAAFLDLDALGRFCLLPEDDLALAEVLKGPFLGLTDDDLIKLAPGRGGSLWQALRAVPDYEAPRDWLEQRVLESRNLRPFEFFTRALDGPDRKRDEFAARLGGVAQDVIGEFLSLTLAHEREEPASLQGFLAYAAARAQTIKRDMEEAQGRIRVMTVHGAKGLEAPIVFLVDTCAEPKAPRDAWLRLEHEGRAVPLVRAPEGERDGVSQAAAAREQERQYQEYLRLLYVAMTRARDRLYVAGVAGERDLKQGVLNLGCWHARIEAALAGLAGVQRIVDEGGEILRFGEEPLGPGKRADKGPPVAPLPAWSRVVPRAEPQPLRRTPSGLLAAEEADLPILSPMRAADAMLRGRLTHKLLEELPKLPVAERGSAARRLFTLPRYRGLAGVAPEILGEVTRILEDGAFAPVFGAGSRAEVAVAGAFTTQAGQRLFISGQIDRLLVEEQRVLILDYKTNRELPNPLPRPYLAQMAAYRLLLREVFPQRAIEAALLFTSVPRLVALAAADLDVIAVTEPAAGGAGRAGGGR